MRDIRWLHISDFHMQDNPSSAQDAVLTAMLDDIGQRYMDGLVFDFVLATGDLAFSGKESEYTLVEAFFDQLVDTISLPRDMIFCIPGNHDVNRDRQKTCFVGARSILNDQSAIYSFLEDNEERETLLIRQSNFREFQGHYFQGQKRDRTEDNLGYVSIIEVDDIRIAIMGLNSAWLADGGQKDNNQLLLGEQQVKNAIKIAKQGNPHIVIGMTHHPFDLLRDFDRNLNRKYLEESCNYFHCGHLHVPYALSSVSHSGSFLTLATGALFESREAYNAYTTVTLDPLHAKDDISFIQYNPTSGTFSLEDKRTFPHQFDAPIPCDVGKLALALELYCPTVADMSYYLAAILLGDISEVPICSGNDFVFGTVDLLQKQPENELKATTINFLTVSNAIKLQHDRKPLCKILATNGGPVKILDKQLKAACKTNNNLQKELTVRNTNARKLAYTDDNKVFQHTMALFDELLAAEEWETLRMHAERYCDHANPAVAAKAKRMLALCLAQSTEHADCNRAISLYRELTSLADGVAEDWASLATMLTDNGKHDQAKETVINAINAFPQSINGYVEIGMKIVEAKGDLDFRKWLSTTKNNRRPT